jgi:hypothetical protein
MTIFNLLAGYPNPSAIASYNVSSSATSVNEGSSVTFYISTNGFVDGTVLYWTNNGTSASNRFEDNTNSGSFTLTDNFASVTRTLLLNKFNDGSTNIVFNVRPFSTSGPIVATKTVTINDTSNTYDGLTLVYDFTSNNATAAFFGVTITGNAGGAGSISGGTGGTYSITNTNGNANGINGGNGYGSGGFGGNGTRGGSIGGGYNTGSNDISSSPSLYYAVGQAGYAGDSTFGSGGVGGANYGNAPGNGSFAGGGGGGGAYVGGGYGVGGNAAIILYYVTNNYSYYQVINQSAGDGSFTFANSTRLVKIWAIGKGGNGNPGPGGANSGAGGGGAGCAYCTFT